MGEALLSAPASIVRFRFGETLAFLASRYRQSLDMAKMMVTLAMQSRDPDSIKKALEVYVKLASGTAPKIQEQKTVQLNRYLFGGRS